MSKRKNPETNHADGVQDDPDDAKGNPNFNDFGLSPWEAYMIIHNIMGLFSFPLQNDDHNKTRV